MTNTSGAAGAHEEPVYVFKLYIAGDEQNSELARQNLRHICREQLQGRCRIQEVDVLTDFAAALADRVFVTPTLIVIAPGPRAVIVGNLVDRQKVIAALHIRPVHGA